MHFYIDRDPRDDGLGERVPEIPGGLLTRHGARVLDLPVAGRDAAASATAYRVDAMRVPHSVDRAVLERALADINLKLVGPAADVGGAARRAAPPVARL
ncbi:hypothetical protein, partial [Actinophytocola sp.]|uniref:hypothetical protein n=1 Tax=Actinophytocola sp. TaxID=1872138 RepID=UPI003D6A9607